MDVAALRVVIVGSKCKVCKTSLHMKGKYCAPWYDLRVYGVVIYSVELGSVV